MIYEELDHLCRANALRMLGGFPVDPERDIDLAGFQTLLMLGPDEPAFWPIFKSSPEFQEPKDPMDHWSKRVIGALSDQLSGKAFFPSDGPPYPPFFTWATRTRRCHSSPVNLLVHDRDAVVISSDGFSDERRVGIVRWNGRVLRQMPSRFFELGLHLFLELRIGPYHGSRLMGRHQVEHREERLPLLAASPMRLLAGFVP